MGHYLTLIIKTDTDNEIKFPTIEASIYPLIWAKSNNHKLGYIEFIVTYEESDKEKLEMLSKIGTEYEKQLAHDIIETMKDHLWEQTSFIIELSTGTGGLFLKMFDEILPKSAEFKDSHYTIKHDHTTRTKIIADEAL